MPPPSIQPHRRRRWWWLVAALVMGRGCCAEELAEEGVQAERELARAPQARGDDHARQVLLGSFHGVINNAEGQVDNVLMKTARYNPINEQRLDIERVNDSRQLQPDSGRQFFFF
jgi:hypothetical protein